jgi:very-long-chain enoyl-CoA reductase
MFVTYPDPTEMLDAMMLCLLGFFTFAGLLANMCKIPFLMREGGLFTYSKFAAGVNFGPNVPSRVGMLLIYGPAWLISAYYWLYIATSSRTELVALLTAIHFFKRCFECAFIHRYSGSMPLASSLNISLFYCLLSFSGCYYSSKAQPLSEEEFPYVNVSLFAIGLLGNFYHHWLLASLRKTGEKKYSVPQGGLFSYVAAPHYFFELIGWLGLALTSAHFIPLLSFVSMTVYLFDRAMGQTSWNQKTFKDYPRSRKHIIPFVF